CVREVSVEIPAEVVDKQQKAIIEQYAKQARVPGFRKGKVPASVVKNRFKDEVTSDLVEQLVPQYFREAVMKAGHRPVSQPQIFGLEFTPGEPMKFKAAFEVLPDFELGEYKVKVEKPEVKVGDEEVEKEITQLQERQASYDPVNEERGAKKGEFVQVSFEAKPKGPAGEAAGESEEKGESVEAKAGTAEASRSSAKAEGEEASETTDSKSEEARPVQMDEVLVEIGGANTIPEFSENLKGAKAGEERSFEVAYPADFYDKRLAGLTFNYKVKVNAIKTKSVPELNDDFAKELSNEFKTLDDLKQRIRENMELERKHQAEHEVKGKVVDELVAKHDFAVPRSLVEHQIDLRLERGLRALAAQGMKTEDMKRMDFARLRAGQREAAVKEVKSNVLLAKIAIKENIQVSDEELEQEIAAMAQQMQQPVDEVKKRLMQDGSVERLRDRIRTEKALNFLYEQAG
ncbi:MAG TPA: trigger factor, partial [Candidatus Angelobacter sp.]|nr:trigger factor [Candidatus Angelobacter sp.]